MKAAVFKGDGKLLLEDRPDPRVITPNDVLLEVKGVGLCGTDLHILEVPPRHPAKPDIILGHEHCGKVVETGKAVSTVKVGDHVAVDHNAACGHCAQCRAGFPNACETVAPPGPDFVLTTPGIFRDGALAKYIVIPDYYCYPVSANVPWHHLAIAEPVACALNAVRKSQPQIGETAAVLGAGPVGLLIISMLVQSGVRVISSEMTATRRDAALEIGAAEAVDPAAADLVDVVHASTGNRGVDIVVDAAVGPTLPVCIKLARFGGRIVLFGHDESAVASVAQAEVMRKELNIHGAFMTRYTFLPALCLIEEGRLPLDRVISHVMPLDRVAEAYELMRCGEALKIVIDPSA